MNSRPLFSFVIAAALALVPGALTRADDATSSIKFSDPSKPGTVKISLGRGELKVEGTDTPEVTITSDVKAANSKPRKDGLRELTSASSFALSEKNNVVSLDAPSHDWGRGGGSFKMTVPRNTTIIVQNAWGGDIACSGISGDVEINSMQGQIRLDDIAGGVVVSTMNGEIKANIRELSSNKPLSFTSMNGEVILRVPESAKANVRLRTQNGSVLTDFDESALVTKTENSGAFRARSAFVYKSSNGKVLSAEIQDAIKEATMVSATAVKEALEAVKEGFEAAKLNAEEARRQFEDARRELDQARTAAEREKRNQEREQRAAARAEKPAPAPVPPKPVAGVAPVPPIPAKVPVPTISGGKLVTGTLNGGGPEISVATMNGDVILRKLELK